MEELFTIGYEGLSTETFLERLRSFDVSTLVDIREKPISRKKGFSKSSLSNYLKNNGIEYVHIRELGSPSMLRKKLKETNDYEKFFSEYSNYLTSTAGSHLQYLHLLVQQRKKACIMCFERDVKTCHRSIVAKKIKKLNGNGLSVRHI